MSLQAAAPRLILASQSGVRAGLLREAGLVFEALPARIDEAAIKQGAWAEKARADDTALLLADMKAQRLARSMPEALVIGADQLLVCEGVWFDKPEDVDAAAAQLRALRGKAHVLVTAVVCWLGGQRVWHHVTRPKLTMRTFSEGFLAEYLAREGEAVCASVGAYRLEGMGMHLFERIEGEHAAILGLPMMALLEFLRQHKAVLG